MLMDNFEKEIEVFQKEEISSEQLINLLLSENYNEYRVGIDKFRLYLDYQYPNLDESIVKFVKKQLIPKMLFYLDNLFYCNQLDVLNQINLIQEILKKHNFENSFIENGLVYTLIRLISLNNKKYDLEIIKLFVLLLHSSHNKYRHNIQVQIIVFIGTKKVMQMIEYQSHQATKIKQIALLCNIKDQNYFDQKKIFIDELCQILLKESNQSGQFITAIELISDIVHYQKIKLILMEKRVLQPIIDAIPNWIKQYRSVLDSTLKICLEFIMYNKIAQQLVVTSGLLNYLGLLLQSQFYGITSFSLKIVKYLCNDKYMVERLYINSVVQILLKQYIQIPRSFQIMELLVIVLEFGKEMFYKYCKDIAQEFIQAFLKSFLSFQELELCRSQLNLITVFKNENLFYDEIQQYFLENQIIKERMKSLYIKDTWFFDFYQINKQTQ